MEEGGEIITIDAYSHTQTTSHARRCHSPARTHARTKEDVLSVELCVLLRELENGGEGVLLVQKVVQSLLRGMELVGGLG